jgi:hypothetical protein
VLIYIILIIFYFYLIDFLKIITDGFTDGLSPSDYSIELENNYCKCHCLITDGIAYGVSVGDMPNSLRKIPTE